MQARTEEERNGESKRETMRTTVKAGPRGGDTRPFSTWCTSHTTEGERLVDTLPAHLLAVILGTCPSLATSLAL